ncbi:MAG: hypothetical protein Aureis2KO_09670 [Aureisphaera sp.]
MLVALLAFGFTACDNEPLEGEFVQEEQGNSAEEGEFIATVGVSNFVAEIVNATYFTASDVIIINGVKANGEVITLSIGAPDVGTFSLTSSAATANSGTYFPIDGDFYFTEGLNGGTGQLDISSFDQELQTVSGTFAFLGVRQQLDANGDPVLDSSGNPLYESRTISDGAFNSIPFDINDTGDGGDGGDDGGDDPTDPADSFFANVDGVEFEDIELVVNETIVGGIDMLNVIATRANGGTIRIDIPRDLGVGTFEFNTPISDGTDLIAIFDNGGGGESLTSYTGTINITEFSSITGKLAATFSYEASDPLQDPSPVVINVTDGEFNVDFLPDSSGAETVFTAEIDALEYIPTSIEVTDEPFGDDVRLITITTINSDENRSLTIQFPDDITVGTYDMAPIFEIGDEKVGLLNPDIGNSILFRSNPGTLTISSIEYSSGIIEGSFNFTAQDIDGIDPTIYEITNGNFVVTMN